MLNAAELASRLGVSTTSIYDWGHDGIIGQDASESAVTMVQHTH